MTTLHSFKTLTWSVCLSFLSAPVNAQPARLRTPTRAARPITSAPTKPICAQGSGLWALSSGELECRECPNNEQLQSGLILKMPMGCAAPIYGAFLEMDLYSDMKATEEYCRDLETFKAKLTPSLDRLSLNVEALVEKVKIADAKYVDALTRLQREKENKAHLSGQNQWLIGSTIALSVVSVVSLVVIYQSRDRD